MAEEAAAQPAAPQPSAPTNGRVPRPVAHNIAAGALGGYVALILVWVVHQTTSIVIPAEVAQAISGLVTMAVSLAVPHDMEAP